jgi:hypothetical protein
MLTVPIVLAIVIIGVLAMKSRGSDDAQLKATDSKDCAPVARADAVATKPGVPISIDVLANDTDPDGDPLVFQILSTQGGESTIDDGGTPTDASDDRVLFTPEDPAPAEAKVEYQALDPQGAVSESLVTVSINEQGALAAGESSDTVTESEGDGTGRCDGGVVRSSTTAPDTTLTSGPPYTGSVTVTTKKAGTSTKKKSSSARTTRTTRAPSTNTPTTQHTTTSRPPTTSPPTTDPPDTTTPPTTGPPATTPPSCGSPDPQSPNYNPDYKQCVKDHARP